MLIIYKLSHYLILGIAITIVHFLYLIPEISISTNFQNSL